MSIWTMPKLSEAFCAVFDLTHSARCEGETLLPGYFGNLSESLWQADSLAAPQVSYQGVGPVVPVLFLPVCKINVVQATLVSLSLNLFIKSRLSCAFATV